MTAIAPPLGASALTIPSPVAALVREHVLEAAAAGRPLRIVGGGTWLDAGRPVRADTPLWIGEHDGIVEYEPGDLTLTAKAGTPLRAIRKVVAGERQWLALDPSADSRATLGATVATASYGPLAHAFGTPRDQVLGVEFVTGAGDVVRGGGRVVKNVAGFDLARLVTGSWGTLGVITEVTVRLRAKPEVDVTVVLAAPEDERSLAPLLQRLRTAPIAPVALELVEARLARAAKVAEGTAIVARLAGNEELVRAQESVFRSLGDVVTSDTPLHGLLDFVAESGHPDMPRLLMRLSHRSSRLAETWAEAQRLSKRLGGTFLRATVGRGVVRLSAIASDDAIRDAFLAERGVATRLFERLPAGLWPVLAPSAVLDRLSRGVRDAFDPHRLLNPGILGE